MIKDPIFMMLDPYKLLKDHNITSMSKRNTFKLTQKKK
jgi:hypothetical protein